MGTRQPNGNHLLESTTSLAVEKAVAVEKADAKLGVIIFKCLATTPDVADADGDILDAESMERAFYDFMASQDVRGMSVDFDHKEDVPGKIVAGWYFPDEHVYRVAFRPDDTSVVEMAVNGEIAGSSFSGTATRQPL